MTDFVQCSRCKVEDVRRDAIECYKCHAQLVTGLTNFEYSCLLITYFFIATIIAMVVLYPVIDEYILRLKVAAFIGLLGSINRTSYENHRVRDYVRFIRPQGVIGYILRLISYLKGLL